MMKRICACCLILALTASLVTAMPVLAASGSDEQLLCDLGIIDIGDGEGLIPKGFGRGDFARSILLMSRNDTGLDISGEKAGEYASDIANDKNLRYIAAAIDLGYMDTDSSGKFNPSGSVSLEVVLTAATRLLGYGELLGNGYDCYGLASKLGLMKGVSPANAEKLTSEEVLVILANTMSAKILRPDSIDYSESCLWDRWNILEGRGKILANSNMGLLVSSTGANRVNIDGETYYTRLLIENELVGSTVTYYTLKGEKGMEVVSIFPENESTAITLKPDEITTVVDSGSVLTVKTDKKKIIKIDKKGFMLVNGKTMSPQKNIFDVFDSGTVTFADTDSNGSYDVVHMSLLFQTVLEGVNPNTETLATRYDNQIVDLDKVDNYEVFIGKKAAALSELESGMPLGIACDAFEVENGELKIKPAEAKYIRLYASRRQDTGCITEMLSDKFAIEGMTKTFGSGYRRLIKNRQFSPLESGYYVTAYYDNMGELTYYEIVPGGGLQYGYLIGAASGGSALDSSTKFKILGTDGKINIYTSGSRFILDSESVSAGSTTYTVNTTDDVDLTKRQVVRYRAQEDVLREIDTTVVRAFAEDANNTLDEALALETTKHQIRSGSIEREFAFASDCVMFIDEAEPGDTGPDDKLFSVHTVGAIGSAEYYMSGYDANDDCELSCIVRYDGYSASMGEAAKGIDYWSVYCSVVESVKRAMDDDGDLGWKLTLAGDSKKDTYFVPEDGIKLYSARSAADWGGESLNVYREEVSDFASIIKPGDIIRFRTGMDGSINYIEKMFDFESHKDVGSIPVPGNSSGQEYGFVKLEKTSADYIIYSEDDTDKRYISRKSERYNVVPLYHVSTGKVEMVPFEQLPASSTGNKVMCFIRYYNYGIVYDNLFYIYE